ncbi:hypothetical protein RJ640_022149 [Escallonia rubra]|uniref:DUF632 domain-containing protein n=1 Tax=Escallonia rubra TaxID=112253 RepID=A0AA88QRV9_9ASTE|nr:hypothetical protein RJ640_022149 [Escallonia rubra]
MPSSSRLVTEEEWEARTLTSEAAVTTTAASTAAPPSAMSVFSKGTAKSELAVVVSTKTKDLVEMMKELDEYFQNAADAGGQLSLLLEVPSSTFSGQRFQDKVCGQGKNLTPLLWTWGSNPKLGRFGKFGDDMVGGNFALKNGSHGSTVERLNAWEKKLYLEVKNAETLKMEHEKRAAQLRRLEMKRADYMKTEKTKKEVEKLESRMMVASQGIEATSAEIVKLRELELYPQLVELVKGLSPVLWTVNRGFCGGKVGRQRPERVRLELAFILLEGGAEAIDEGVEAAPGLAEGGQKGQGWAWAGGEGWPNWLRLMCMWRSMYECHQVQTHIVQQLKYLDTFPSFNPTSEIHRQSTLQLEVEVQQWHLSFCNLVKAQRDYIQSLTGWLRLSLFQFCNGPLLKTKQDSAIYSLCEEWQLAVDNAPDKVASEGIKAFLTVIHAIVVQQAEEQKQKKRSESVFKELEKKVVELRSLECKYGPYASSSGGKDPVTEKRAKVEILRAKAEDERAKHEKLVSVTRAMTLNNLQMGLPHVFQAVTGFANVWTHAFETVYSQAKSTDEVHDVKRLLP